MLQMQRITSISSLSSPAATVPPLASGPPSDCPPPAAAIYQHSLQHCCLVLWDSKIHNFNSQQFNGHISTVQPRSKCFWYCAGFLAISAISALTSKFDFQHRVSYKYCIATIALKWARGMDNTHTTQPFYGSVEFVRENPGEPVPEETFTHYSHRSHQSSLSAFSI